MKGGVYFFFHSAFSTLSFGKISLFPCSVLWTLRNSLEKMNHLVTFMTFLFLWNTKGVILKNDDCSFPEIECVILV